MTIEAKKCPVKAPEGGLTQRPVKATAEVAATNAALAAKGGTSNRPVSSVVHKPAKTPAKAKGATFTSVDLAKERGINPKTLRARIRRNIDKWAPLFKDGTKHVFADNATTRKAIAALLEA